MKNHFTFLLICILFIGSCKSNNNNNDDNTSESTETGIFERLDVAQFQKRLAGTSYPQLIDVRTPEEYAQGTIQNAVNMNFHGDDFENQLNTLDKTKPVFVFCQVGGRSLKSAKKMQAMGFEKVYELEVGYSGWEQ